MNIPLIQRPLLTALKPFWDYLECGSWEWVPGTPGSSGARLCHFLGLSTHPGQGHCDGILPCLTDIGVPPSFSPMCAFSICLKFFRRTFNSGLQRQLRNEVDAGSTPRVVNDGYKMEDNKQ